MTSVASATDTTHGTPSSRETIIAWLPMAPTLTTTPAAGTKSGTHDGSVCGAMRMSPGSNPLRVSSVEDGLVPVRSPSRLSLPTRSALCPRCLTRRSVRAGSSPRDRGPSRLRRTRACVRTTSGTDPSEHRASTRWFRGECRSRSSSASVAMNTFSMRSIVPRSASRLPNSRNATRISLMIMTRLVLARSRPARNSCAEPSAALEHPGKPQHPRRPFRESRPRCDHVR